MATADSADRHVARLPADERTWHYPSTEFGPIDVVVRAPERSAAGPTPVLFAFHGRGESLRGPKRGARGWLDDYDLEKAAQRLAEPPLTKADFGGFVTRERLERLNRALSRHPYRDLLVVMPYLPDVLKRDDVFRNGPALADFVTSELVPRVRREFPEIGAGAFGIDGVSLGGRAALFIGFTRPKAFSTVAALQPAIDEGELGRFTALAADALRENHALSIRLVTSHEDYYREVVMAFASELNTAKVPHDFELLSGDHSYEFNRGPGAIEMLRFHSEALRR